MTWITQLAQQGGFFMLPILFGTPIAIGLCALRLAKVRRARFPFMGTALVAVFVGLGVLGGAQQMYVLMAVVANAAAEFKTELMDVGLATVVVPLQTAFAVGALIAVLSGIAARLRRPAGDPPVRGNKRKVAMIGAAAAVLGVLGLSFDLAVMHEVVRVPYTWGPRLAQIQMVYVCCALCAVVAGMIGLITTMKTGLRPRYEAVS